MTNPSTKAGSKAFPFLDQSRPLGERVDDLVSRMSLAEKVSQMSYQSPEVARLGIPEYNWWSECLHGVGRAGIATVFPQAIGLAATFDVELVGEVATAISDEARAKHHEAASHGDRRIYKGLTFWTPNVNIFRDPRWGRGQETYGEDPFLTGRMGVAFVKGLQGDDPRYLKLVATPKHFAVHSGPESLRHEFNAVVSEKDLRETYLPAFKECVVEGGALSIMGAYSRTNGEPCCASPTLLTRILRGEWRFSGFVVSDCGAIADLHLHHRVTESQAHSAALAVRNGCDLCCGSDYRSLVEAVERGLLSEAEIDRSVKRLFTARFRLGMFDEPGSVAYAQIPIDVNDSPEHRSLALEAARESIVLLKNAESLLPLRKNVRRIAVIGPNADSRSVLLGNYNGFPSRYVTILDGIRSKVSDATRILYARGCDLVAKPTDPWGRRDDDEFSEACSAAERSDVVVMCLGISASLEGEEGDTSRSDTQGDRSRIELPEIQERLLAAVAAVGKPIVLVVLSGSAIALRWAADNVPAIVGAWYPGEEGGSAVADVLFGDYSPAGRLPITCVRSLDQLPPFTDYSMKGRTYRYLTEEPLFPFGYGLSYAKFAYSHVGLDRSTVKAGESVHLRVRLENSGPMNGDEVVQVYLTDVEASVDVPRWSLRAFRRIHLDSGESADLAFEITARQLAMIDNDGRCVLEPGMFRLYVGGSQPDARSFALTGVRPLSVDFEVTGTRIELDY